MCGIFGYIGPEDSALICLAGLKKLEYRGYDSAGIAGIAGGELLFCKEVGKIRQLEERWNLNPRKLGSAIAHTRWATHGKPSAENAHPHFDQHFNIAVVHNGIVENHRPLREMLRAQGMTFQSETDTEVIAQLIAHFYTGDLLSAVQSALSIMQGFWGIAVIHKSHPDMIVAAARENPIAIGQKVGSSEVFLSSDPNAFHTADLDLLFLKTDEMALLQPGKIEIFDQARAPVIKIPERISIDPFVLSKGNFEHYMLKEISEQGETIQKALHSRVIEEFGSAEFENFPLSPGELKAVKNVVILGCGTSWHAGCIAASLIEEKASIPARAEIASEFRCKNPILPEDTLVIAISQSGETLDTISAVREVRRKGVKVVAVCNVRNSTLHREADATLFLRAGPEISVCSTKAFTSQITVLALFALLMGRLRHVTREEGQLFLNQLCALPNEVEAILAKSIEIEQLAKKYAIYDSFFFLGRHYMYTASLEGALKLKEIAYVNAVGYPAGEMKHGPIALVDPDLAVIGLCGNRRTYDKMVSNLTEVRSRGAPILAIAFEGAEGLSDVATDLLLLPPTPDALAAIPFAVATQLLAYFIARERGTDIDQPRNLAKSVTVE
jgi:glucosamine--fructose-6-phosphate aminotransferase (isomerizing)